MIQGILSAAFALLVWGVTFANTRALLEDFSALEIMVVRFALAWVVLVGMERTGKRLARGASPADCGRAGAGGHSGAALARDAVILRSGDTRLV